MNVSIFLVRAVVEAVERSGVPRADVVSRLGVDGGRLEQPEERLALEDFARVLSAAIDVSRDEALGLHVAEQMSDNAVDLLAHLAAHAPTMRDALAVANQFGPLVFDGLQVAAHDGEDTFVVRCTFPRLSPLWDRSLAELMAGGLVRLARRTARRPETLPMRAPSQPLWSQGVASPG